MKFESVPILGVMVTSCGGNIPAASSAFYTFIVSDYLTDNGRVI